MFGQVMAGLAMLDHVSSGYAMLGNVSSV